MNGLSDAIAMHRCGNLSKRAKRNLDLVLLKSTGLAGLTREAFAGRAATPELSQKEIDLAKAARTRAYAKHVETMATKRQVAKILKQAEELERKWQ